MTVYKAQTVVTNYLDVSTTAPSNPVDGQKWMDGTVMKTWDETKKEWVAEDLKGEVGDAGTGVKDTTIMYSVSTSGTVQPTSGWQSTIPTVPTGSFLWSRTVWTYTDGTSKTGYTVSKIGEDGKTMYVHKAWAWSSDGTDRFTGVYPNENLADDTQFKKGYWIFTKQANGVGSISGRIATIKGVVNEWSQYQLYSNNGGENLNRIENNRTYTISLKARVKTEDSSRQFSINLRKNSTSGTTHNVGYVDPTNLTTSWQKFELTFTIPNNYTDDLNYWRFIVGYSRTGELEFTEPKIEEAVSSTIYTPSPKDDFDNAWPKYEGYYSSHNPVQSTNPSDYTWSVIRGENGKDGTDGKNGTDGKDGVTPKDVISGYLTNESLIVPANPSGVVSDYSKAYGDFVIYEGQEKKTSNVTYSKVSETGMTSTINSTGRYVMTALTADTGTAIYRATYSGVSIDKIVIAVKNKQGSSGVGINSTTITYQASTSGTTPPTGAWLASIPTVAENSYLWTRSVTSYTDNTSSTSYSVSKMGGKGSTGTGVSSSAVTYASSTSGTTAPTSWLANIPTVAEGSYLWTRTVITFSDNTTNTSYSVAKQGATGPQGPPTGVTTQATVPTGPYVGMLWLNTGTIAGYVKGATYKWDGSKWAFYILRAENIVADSLSAISANLGKITAGMILIDFFRGDSLNSAIKKRGTSSISDGRFTSTFDYVQVSNNTVLGKGDVNLDENGFVIRDLTTSGDVLRSVSYKPDKISMTDANFSYGEVDLKYQDLLSLPQIDLEGVNGWEKYAASGDSAPMVERNMRTVTLTGAFKPTATISHTGLEQFTVCVLPIGYRPKERYSTVAPGSGIRLTLINVESNGAVTISRNRDNDGYTNYLAGGWYSIACSFNAGDI